MKSCSGDGRTEARTARNARQCVRIKGIKIVEATQHVAGEIGPIAKPKAIFVTPDLPKTRSGKIMRRLLRDVAEGRNIGDTTTLADASIVDELQQKAAESSSDD